MKDRNDTIDDLKRKLDDWNAEMAELEAKANVKKLEAEHAAQARWRELRSKLDAAEGQLKELREASSDSWQALAKGAEKTWDDLRTTMADTKRTFLDAVGK